MPTAVSVEPHAASPLAGTMMRKAILRKRVATNNRDFFSTTDHLTFVINPNCLLNTEILSKADAKGGFLGVVAAKTNR
jgi:hypothetical protein